ncbi:MAG: metallophosphoesterase [Acidobacteria bacterium OLB17]|nr:MAG: metallophosphoesterase [Acidobacteria bacterium OLB17]MCZ2390578.1 bifunctional metallophosphatase/5'-nucleotidase [Acidobacteriota bacterium]
MKKLSFAALFAVLLTAAALVPAQKLNVLYTNDLHSHFDPQIVPWADKTRPIGGFANIAALVKREKAANPNTVYFDAGDFFAGPYVSSLTKGEAIIDAANYLGLDAACVGNHEYDYGWENAYKQFQLAKFPLLNGNIFVKGTDNLHWNKPYIIKEVNGIRLGIIGLHEKFAFEDTVAPVMVKGVEVRDEKVYLRKYIKELQPKTDLIVLLIHIGIPGTQSTGGEKDVIRNHQHDIDLANAVPGVDLMITGHPHSGTPTPIVANGTIIVSTDAYTIELGKLEITYDKKLDKITDYKNHFKYLYDDEVEDDPEMVRVINKWKDKLRSITEEKLTTLTAPLTRSYSESSGMGNMTADSMLAAYPEYDLAVTNSGGLRQDLEKGVVTVGQLISVFPFPNTIVQLEIKGRHIREAFEHGAGLTNGIVQVSKGVQFTYDESRPVGSRITKFSIKGVPLDDEKTYKVLTSNYLADGGDGYFAFGKASSYKLTGVDILDAMIKYLKQFRSFEPDTEKRAQNVTPGKKK